MLDRTNASVHFAHPHWPSPKVTPHRSLQAATWLDDAATPLCDDDCGVGGCCGWCWERAAFLHMWWCRRNPSTRSRGAMVWTDNCAAHSRNLNNAHAHTHTRAHVYRSANIGKQSDGSGYRGANVCAGAWTRINVEAMLTGKKREKEKGNRQRGHVLLD